jgi:hypothetical protein
MRYLAHMRNGASENTYADSTLTPEPPIGARVGRKMEYPDKCIAALPAGSFKRIGAVLRDGQDRTDWLREAVAEKLAREGSEPEQTVPTRVPR